MSGVLEQIDAHLADALAKWNIYTTVLATVIALLLIYPFFLTSEPDLHPLLLSRQARSSPVRQKNESATYRCLDVPPGNPLRSGLDIRDPGAPRWKAGRDGDLRDIWRAVIQGGPGGTRGEIMTCLGKEELVKHDIDQVSKHIGALGHALRASGAERVAICLPNSIEYLCALFACVFYGITPVLVPYQGVTASILRQVKADVLITQAGTLALDDLEGHSHLKHMIWVVDENNRHMSWTEEGLQSNKSIKVSVLHELVEANNSVSEIGLPFAENYDTNDIIVMSHAATEQQYRLTNFTQKNIVAGVVGALFSLPPKHRLVGSDVVLPADSICKPFVLCQVLAALFSHSSVILNAVAGDDVQLALAARWIAPTVVVASCKSLGKHYDGISQRYPGILERIARYFQRATLRAGQLPNTTLMSRFINMRAATIGSMPGRLRLILSSQSAEQGSQAISKSVLNEIRIATGARICVALAAPNVAGAVTQTNVFDYRSGGAPESGDFGVPTPSVEIKLRNPKDEELDHRNPRGEVIARGPAVAKGEAALGVQGVIMDDCTLALMD